MTGRRRGGGKYLSYVLRHDPAKVGVELGDGGWVDVGELLEGMASVGRGMSREELGLVVDGDDKGRFEMRDGRIRAVYGHSVGLTMDLEEAEPPRVLFHGTVERFLPSILREGLRPMKRQWVHLSVDTDTAEVVGRRRGEPLVLQVSAHEMAEQGAKFYHANDKVWLVAKVPPEFIEAPATVAPDADAAGA